VYTTIPAVIAEVAVALGGTTALALLILAFTRCEVTRWHIQRALAVARRQPFTEPRPTDCGCRRCTRYRRRQPPAPPLPDPQPPPWPPKP
jgi:hypothetical protein